VNAFQQLRFQHTRNGAIPLITIKLNRGEDIKRPGRNCLGSNRIRPCDLERELPKFVQDVDKGICAKRVVLENAVSFVALSLVI
jgi:hypothetical protein